MDPSYDDLADTITANLRTMRATAIKMDALENAVFSMMAVLGLFLTVIMVSKLRSAK